MDVTLTWPELQIAAMIGVQRHVMNLKEDWKDFTNKPADRNWQNHVEGAAGEMAVAKAFGFYWSGSVGDRKAKDVGGLQVRTRSRTDYDLILHDHDNDGDRFVLVVGLAPRFSLVGWIYGHEGKKREYWKDPARERPAYFVPQAVLHSMDELMSLMFASPAA